MASPGSTSLPFPAEDWDRVVAAASAIAEASEGGEPVLERAALRAMRRLIKTLRAAHGEQPILLETLADFEDRPRTRIRLYRAARDRALALGEPTLSIRLALAEVLFRDLGAPAPAMAELEACRHELFAGEDYLRAEYFALRQLLRRELPTGGRRSGAAEARR